MKKEKSVNWMAVFYLIKFAFFNILAGYSYSINSKWALGLFGISMLQLAYFIIEKLKIKE